MKWSFQQIKGRCGEIVDSVLSSPDIPDNEDLIFKIRLSVEEAVENVISYAYGDDDGGLDIDLCISEDHNALVITLMDTGVPFNPLSVEEPDNDVPIMERKIGGLGIFLMRQMMDSVNYCREGDCNVLTMKIIKP